MILIRHARSVVDPATPAADWSLAPGAVESAAELGQHLQATTLIASTERKAIDTAAALGLGPVLVSEAFCEVTRPFYDDPNGLDETVARWFAGETVDGWEPHAEAVTRFAGGLAEHAGDGLVVVTHGTVMTAWLASTGAVTDPMAFWRDLRMPDAFAVGDGSVQRYPAA